MRKTKSAKRTVRKHRGTRRTRMLKGGLPMLDMPDKREDDSYLLKFVRSKNYQEGFLQSFIEHNKDNPYINSPVKLNDNLNLASDSGVTVLMACAYLGFEEDFKYLLQKGYANFEATITINGEKMDAFDIAKYMAKYYQDRPDRKQYESTSAKFNRIAQIHPKYNPVFVSMKIARDVARETPGVEHYIPPQPRQPSIELKYTLGDEAEEQKSLLGKKRSRSDGESPPGKKRGKKGFIEEY